MPLSDRPIEGGSRIPVVISCGQKPQQDGATLTHIDTGIMALDVNVVQTVAAGGGASGDVNIHDGAGTALTSTLVGADQALDVNIVAGAGAGGTSMTDDAAFTPAVTAITPAGAMFDDVAPDSVDEGDAGVVRMSANRNLYTTLRDAAGNERGANVNASNQLEVNVSGTLTGITNDVSIDDGGNSITVDDGGVTLGVDDGGGSLTIDDGGLAISVDDNGGSLTIDNAALAVVGGGVEATALRVTVANDSTGVLSVDDNGGSLTVDNAALSVTGGGVEATALRVTIANDSTGVVTVDDGGGALTVDGTVTASNAAGDIADDAVDSGNPVKIGGVAVETDGTDPGSVSAEGDRTQARTDRQRRILVNPYNPYAWITNNNYAAAQTNQQQKAAPGANLSLYVQRFIISTDGACNIRLVDDTAGAPATIAGPYYIAANAGANIAFEPPLRVDANTDIGITSSAAVNHTITITGYTAP